MSFFFGICRRLPHTCGGSKISMSAGKITIVLRLNSYKTPPRPHSLPRDREPLNGHPDGVTTTLNNIRIIWFAWFV